jgi:hypothetical protein
MENEPSYLSATRHPWSCLLFLLPLLLVYEGGVLSLGGPRADALRNGVDAWLRLGLTKLASSNRSWCRPWWRLCSRLVLAAA